jgi:hypothetical protein
VVVGEAEAGECGAKESVEFARARREDDHTALLRMCTEQMSFYKGGKVRLGTVPMRLEICLLE